MKKAVFYSILFSFVVIFFAVVEIGLRIAGIGLDFSLVVPHPEKPDFIMSNPNLAGKYFNDPELSEFGYENVVLKNKVPGTFRIVALGASTTAGFPYFYNASFPAMVKQQLQDRFPEQRIELVNLGMSAISTMCIRDMSHELSRFDPDAVVIYCGHNEFYGVMGANWGVKALNQTWLKQLVLSLRKFRLYQLISLVMAQTGDSNISSSTLMERLSRDKPFSMDDPRRERTFAQFSTNLSRIVKSARKSAPVYLCTVTSNEKDQEPFSAPSTAYVKGLGFLESGSLDSGRVYLTIAKDEDEFPFRAPDRINELIKTIAHNEQVTLVDIDSLFRAQSEDHLPGKNLFLEHVHPNLYGNKIISEEIAAKIVEKQFKDHDSNGYTSSWSYLQYITQLDTVAAHMQLSILMDNPPFTNTPGIGLSSIQPANKIEYIARQMLSQKLNYYTAHMAMASYYREMGLIQDEIHEYAAIVEAFYFEPVVHKTYIYACIQAQQFDVAEMAVHRLLKIYSNNPYGNKWAGILAVNRQDSRAALPYLMRAKQLRDDNQVRYNLSGAWIQLNDFTRARAELDTILMRDPHHENARSLLVRLPN